MKSLTKNLNVLIDMELYKKLKVHSIEIDKPFNQVVAMAIEEYLIKHTNYKGGSNAGLSV